MATLKGVAGVGVIPPPPSHAQVRASPSLLCNSQKRKQEAEDETHTEESKARKAWSEVVERYASAAALHFGQIMPNFEGDAGQGHGLTF